MTKSSDARRARKAAAKAKPQNGILELPVSDVLKFKLQMLAERLDKHKAEMKVIETHISATMVERNKVVAEITKEHEERLENLYEMQEMSFITGIAKFALKGDEPKPEEPS